MQKALSGRSVAVFFRCLVLLLEVKSLFIESLIELFFVTPDSFYRFVIRNRLFVWWPIGN